MLSAVIIDDEYKGRLALKQKILDYCKDIMIIGEAADGKEGLELINEKKPDIVFLDIEMPLVNGFEMLQNLKERNFHLIFTTAYNHYAIKAIKYSAFDYLLKPIDIEELKATAQKLMATTKSNIDLQIELLQGNFQDKNRPLKN
ncbi:MAG: response regulator [Saprospiraceae bacterium]|nr:response regulator [Saprospiraceae bacterium]